MLKKATAKYLSYALLFFLISSTAQARTYLSPATLTADEEGKKLYVAETTANRVAIFDIENEKVTARVKLSGSPSGLALNADGSSLYVTVSSPDGTVYKIDTASKKITGQIHVGHSPIAPVLNSDASRLYVCNRFNNDVSVIDLKAMEEIKTIPVKREPIDAALTKNGRWLFVANHLHEGAGDQDYTAAAISVIDTQKQEVVKTIRLLNGSTALRGISIAPDGKYAYVTHTLARYQLPTTQLERGWMNTSALTIIDVRKKELFNTVLLDDVDLGAANPWGVAIEPTGKYICVAHAGTHEISIIDRAAMHEKLQKVADGQGSYGQGLSWEDVPNSLSFLVGIRKRMKLPGNGPRGVAIVGEKVYTAEYFSDSIGSSEIAVFNTVAPKPVSIALGPKRKLTPERQGEIFFHDATGCFQHWQSCSSCHPDTRADALNWDLLNDGMGNPKQTKSMLLAHKTPPAMITGIRPNAEAGVRAGFKFIQFAVRPEEDAVAIDKYLKSVKPVPSPYLVDGRLSPAAQRGKVIFEDAKCASCHPAPLFANGEKYNTKTGIGRQENWEFDTPTLVEVWRTAPYLHDGRSASIEEVVTIHNVDDAHGKTSKLTPLQISDLVEYVLSL